MKVLMLGWEYPPHISGGLGTACEGLTKALAAQETLITFVIPRIFGDEDACHMKIFSADTLIQPKENQIVEKFYPLTTSSSLSSMPEMIQTIAIDSFLKPYMTPETYSHRRWESEELPEYFQMTSKNSHESSQVIFIPQKTKETHYGSDLFSEVVRFSEGVSQLAQNLNFDLIHAHDWMTYLAAIKVKEITRKPLVLHVHSLEFDRSGQNINSSIYEIESLGLRSADRVIAVSHYTKSVIIKEYGIDEKKISVVHNGVTRIEGLKRYHIKKTPEEKKIVLFLGRITYQKGPEYFIEAASQVIPYFDHVKFVMSGSGDMLEAMKQLVCEKEIEDWFEFTGFLRGRQVEEMYALADLYVMPSVSEPFGIAPLEAVACDTPLIISKQSGVSEVLSHALKIDFWDVNRLAELILCVLENGPLSNELREMAQKELLNIHWEAAAHKTIETYKEILN